MKKFILVIVVTLMAFTSTNVSAASVSVNQAKTVSTDTDVKIELIQNDTVVEIGTNVLTHTRNYTRSNTKTNGDEIVITAPEGVHYLMVQLDKYCGTPKTTGMLEKEQVEGSTRPSNMSSLEYGETLVYLMNNEFHFVIPGLTGTDAGGTTLGGGNWPYDSRAFSTSGNTEKIITARVATEEEINERRNLALNPFDLRGNDNGRTSPNKKGDINVFPHAFANRATDNKREFEPRNAIDGFEYNASHVGFPYQAWGCGNEKTDSEFSVLFGRYVEIDQVDITVRAQWNPPQPNNAYDHDINWTSATLEFSDGTEVPITLQKLASPQTIKLPEKKIVSWVRLKDLPVSEEIIPVDGRKKFSALTEFKVWGTEVNSSNINLPSGESLVNLAKKVNDYWIKTGGNTGNDATNYNHGHSVNSEFWAPSVFYTGNMEAYYLTGDENYTDYASRWGSNNIYNGTAWNTKADTGRIGKYFPDNHTSFQTYLDMYSITANGSFDANDEKIKNVVPIMNEMEQMSISDLKSKKGYWDRIDFFYMELPNWTKMYLLTGEEKWLDKLRALYNDRKAELYDEETGLFYRDKNYIFDANATYNPNGDGSNQKISPNGKKILWSRGNGWAMGALAKVLQDLPDDRVDDRKEYEAVFKKMAATLIQVQGEDGFWRMNLDDYDHDIRPETSGTLFFAYGLTWGINNGLLDKETYYPAVKKAFLGLNANAIRPDGLVGRSELISAYPNPKCSLGIGSSQSYAPAATVLFLSELSKLVEQGYVTNDVEPALNKKMIGNIAVKEDSKYAVVNSKLRELVPGTELKTIKQDEKIYVPKDFVKEVYGENTANGIIDTIVYDGSSYVELNGVIVAESNKKLSSLENNTYIISYKTSLFNSLDTKLTDLLNTGLTDGKYPTRPEYPIRFDYTPPAEEQKPSEDALVSVESNSAGAVSANRLIGPNTTNPVNVEFDMISVLSPSQTNAIVGLGSMDSNYTAYSQIPIIIRMYKDGKFGVYNGTGYVQSNVDFNKNEKYHIRVSIDLEAKKYSVFVSTQDEEEIQIANNFAFRSTAKAIDNIGKIYLFNNDQAAGKYWLEEIYLGEQVKPSKDALVSVESNTGGAISANRLIGPNTKNPVSVEFDMVSALAPTVTNAIVGLGSKDSNYTAYSQVPIIVRMFNDGSFGVYNGTKYVQTSMKFNRKEKYHVRVLIDLEAKKYNVFVSAPNQEEIQIANNFAFRSTAKAIDNIGKIYLFNNDQATGKYWLENIYLGTKTNKEALEEILEIAKNYNEVEFTEISFKNLQDAIIAGEIILLDKEATQVEVDNMVKELQNAIDNLEDAVTVEVSKTALQIAVEMAGNVTAEQLDKVVPAVVTEFNAALEEARVILANDNANQEEVDASFARLATAMHMLE
ncbi:glycoside hydrolase family 88 protein, partial [Thomasclavelia cocleata]|uniref:glycoside hydrolase family 88 protein n=2 Tax=Thomasclavelia cocleata TaxID=69824 RepID=UPI00248AC638